MSDSESIAQYRISAGWLIGFAVAACWLPLVTYAISLALFGLAHVACEFRYLHQRFTSRLHRRLVQLFLVLLLTIFANRIAGIVVPEIWGSWPQVEIGLGAGLLVATGLLAYRLSGRAGALVAIVLGIGFVALIRWNPLIAMCSLAFVHNLTPWGFLVEHAQPEQRRRVAALAAIPFLLIPLAILSGLHIHLLQAVAGWLPIDWEFVPESIGRLFLAHYLPSNTQPTYWVVAFFSAAVFLQLVHYYSVIVVLPRLSVSDQANQSSTKRGSGRTFAAVLIVSSLVLALLYSVDFGQTRQFYGAVAAMHAWIEFPILCLFLPTLLTHSR